MTLKYKGLAGCDPPPMNKEALKQTLEDAVNTIPQCRDKCVVNDLTLDCTGSGSDTIITAKFDVTIFNPHPNEIPLNCTTSCKRDSFRQMMVDSFAVKKGIETIASNTTLKEMLELPGIGAPSIDETQTFPISRPQMLCDPGQVFTKTRLCGEYLY